MHEPLSQRLAEILQTDPEGSRTLNQVLARTGERGLYLVIILLALPFVIPVALPFLSTLLGLSVVALAARMAVGASARLPRLLGDRPWSAGSYEKTLTRGVRLLRWIERYIKPRRTPWLAHRAARTANTLLILFMGILLSLPFPPLPPFTNSLPSYSIILLAACMMEEDGNAIWIAYAVAVGTMVYLALVAKGLQWVVLFIVHRVPSWL